MMRRTLASLVIALIWTPSFAKSHPDCSRVEGYAASMAQAQMKNAGLFDPLQVDFTKTKVTRISSLQIGPDLYRQVNFVRFLTFSGEPIEAITVNEVTSVECSFSGIDVYAVSQKLGDRSDENGRLLRELPKPDSRHANHLNRPSSASCQASSLAEPSTRSRPTCRSRAEMR